jgi:hypothetical protein
MDMQPFGMQKGQAKQAAGTSRKNMQHGEMDVPLAASMDMQH